MWAVLFVVGVLAGYLGYRAIDHQPTTSSAAAPPAPVSGPLTIVGARDYDPAGDGRENPNQVFAVWDKNPATVWTTERYLDRNVGGLKPGVGIIVDLASPKSIDRLEVDSPDRDWSAQVYTSNTIPASIGGWGAPRFTGQGLGTNAQLVLQSGARARYALLWITNLPPGQPYQLRIAEVRVFGSS
jgi:hypothetical protein